MSTPTPETVWSRLYNDVKMEIPGVTDAVFKQVLYQVWDDFTDFTNIWTEEVAIAVDPSTLIYPFTVAKEGKPNRLMVVYDPAQPPVKRWVMGGIEMTMPGTLTLLYAPSTATTWKAVVAKTPAAVDAAGYPALHADDEWIVKKYEDGLHYGVLGRLHLQPVKPYTNVKLAAGHWQYYVAERSRARTDALKSNVFNAQRWTFPQGFATITRKGWT